MSTIDLNGIAAFAAIARHGSFRAAAADRGVTPSALSHALGRLERTLGVRLLTRTTRAVALTEAGERLLARAEPALDDVAAAVEDLNTLRDTPTGRLRVTAPRIAASTVLARTLPSFVQAFPTIQLEISVEDAFQDIATYGFDAGIRLGESLQANMVAIPISPPVAMAVVASPTYLDLREPIRVPGDLRHHACIGLRLLSTGETYAWEFEQKGAPISVTVAGPLIMDDQEMIIGAARNGLGLAYTTCDYVSADLATGTLRRVLTDWMPQRERFFIYHQSRKNTSAALRAFIQHLKA
jgi:DNA-binding transcriptional LysR family regulator